METFDMSFDYFDIDNTLETANTELYMVNRVRDNAQRLVATWYTHVKANQPRATPLYDMSNDTLVIAVNALNNISQQADVVFAPSKYFLDVVRLTARRATQVAA